MLLSSQLCGLQIFCLPIHSFYYLIRRCLMVGVVQWLALFNGISEVKLLNTLNIILSERSDISIAIKQFVELQIIQKINFITFYYTFYFIIKTQSFQFSFKMSTRSLTKDQQIQIMLKQKVVDIEEITDRRGFFFNFIQLAQTKIADLSKNIFGDYSYQRKNNFTVDYKLKIMHYLRQKQRLFLSKLKEQKKKQYYSYDPKFFEKKTDNLFVMKEMILQGKTQVQAAEGSLQRLKTSRDYIRAQFLNQAAYQFDRQRYCSLYWGFMAGCLINCTIYKKGSITRKAALLVTIAHLFGQVSYHLNLDKYFDSVYQIFQEQAEAFMSEQKKKVKQSDKVFIKNNIQ